jgi:hypothetical protein
MMKTISIQAISVLKYKWEYDIEGSTTTETTLNNGKE